MRRALTILILLALPGWAGAQPGFLMATAAPSDPYAPEAPTEYAVPSISSTLAGLSSGATVITPVNSSELTSLLTGGTVDSTTLAAAAASGPVVISLDADVTYAGEFTFPDLDQSDWIYVVSDEYDSLPVSETRVQTSDRTYMPKFTAANNSGGGGYWYVSINLEQGAEKYRFIGLQAEYPAGAYFGAGLFQCGYEDYTILTTGDAASDAELPHDIIIDRCDFHGRDADGTMGDDRKAVWFDVIGGAIVDSRITDIADLTSDDPMAIIAFMGGREVLIQNNALSASGECLILGGIDGYVDYLQDWVIRGNYFFKPLYWNANDASYDGNDRSIKNHLELKKVKRVLIEGNVCENCWADAQFGEAFVFTVRNQDDTDPGAIISDVNCRNNYTINCERGFRISGEDDINTSQLTTRVKITNNLVAGAGNTLFYITSTNDGPISYLTIQNNTCVTTEGVVGENSAAVSFGDAPTLWVDNFIFTDNIMSFLQYGSLSESVIAAKTTNTTNDNNGYIFDAANPDYAFWLGGTTFVDNYPNSIKVDELADADFTNVGTGDYSLQATSPFYQTGTGGQNIGVNWSALQSAISGVAE